MIKKYLVMLRISISNALVYRVNILSRFAFYLMFIYIFMNLWKSIYAIEGVNGYSYIQIVWYLILTEFISFTCRTNIHTTLSEEVKTGTLIYQINRPMHYVFYHFFNFFGQFLVNSFIFGFFGIVLGLVLVGRLTSFDLRSLPYLIISITLSVIINYFFLILIGMTAFVLEDNFPVYLIYQKLGFMLGMFLPVEFLPEWFQPIAKVLPFSYVYWAPAKLLVNFSKSIVNEIILGQLIWALLAVILAVCFFNRSVKNLQINGG